MTMAEVHSPQPIVARNADDERAARCEGHATRTRAIETASFTGPSGKPVPPKTPS
jgi:hypothetical protein